MDLYQSINRAPAERCGNGQPNGILMTVLLDRRAVRRTIT